MSVEANRNTGNYELCWLDGPYLGQWEPPEPLQTETKNADSLHDKKVQGCSVRSPKNMLNSSKLKSHERFAACITSGLISLQLLCSCSQDKTAASQKQKMNVKKWSIETFNCSIFILILWYKYCTYCTIMTEENLLWEIQTC